MNKLTITRNMLWIATLALFCNIEAAAGTFGPPPNDNTTSGNTTSNSSTDIVDTLELVVTVIKNEKPKVSGSLFGDIADQITPTSVTLLDSPAGNYGHLDIFSSLAGMFNYILKNDLPQVQALGISDIAQEVFRYQVITSTGNVIDAKLTVYILGNPSVSYDNVEIEPNNTSAAASPLHAGNALQSGQYMRGQLIAGHDRDWFVINSLGNEIINLELCPEGSQCLDEKAWVMYVFDADKFKQEGNELKTSPLLRYVKETGEVKNETPEDHLYFLFNRKLFDSSLIGIIDPSFGDRRTLDIAVGQSPKSYFIVIGSPLARDESGNVALKEEIPIGPHVTIIQEHITAFPFSDDQYSFRVTRTGENPFSVLSPDFPQFDAIGRSVTIPKMRINDQLFEISLKQLNKESATTPMTFGVQSMVLKAELTSSDPYLPTYNSVNGVVRIPQVVISGTNQIFSVEMLHQPSNNTLILLRADPVK